MCLAVGHMGNPDEGKIEGYPMCLAVGHMGALP